MYSTLLPHHLGPVVVLAAVEAVRRQRPGGAQVQPLAQQAGGVAGKGGALLPALALGL